MKKRFLLRVSALALAGVGALAIKSPVVAVAEGEESPLASEVVEQSSVASEEDVIESSTLEPTSKPTTIADGNGDWHVYTEDELKQMFEKYYNDNIRDQYMFGISLGSIIGFATSLIGILYSIVKTNKTAKRNEKASDNVDRLEEEVSKLKDQINSLKSLNEENTNELTSSISDTLSQMKEMLSQVSDIAKKLPEYEELKSKIDQLGEAIKEANSSLEDVANGTAEKVASIIDEGK